MTKVIDNTNLGYLKGKMDATYWPKTDVVQIGIDSAPTANSTNLVTSGGVYTAIQNSGGGGGGGISDVTLGGTSVVANNVAVLPAYPTTLPASDVSSWAKQSSKPSYTFSEIGSTPTTISGYGITDAGISNGTITLGSNTITPLTSFTESDPVFTASAAYGISSTDINNWNAKQKAITVSSSEPTSSDGSNGDIWIVI